MIRKIAVLTVLLFSALIAACDQSSTPSTGESGAQKAQSGVLPKRKRDFAAFTRGGESYRNNCVQCHGDLAQGAPNWRQPDANGRLPAPPLNGTGHAWHHPKKALIHTIKNGTIQMGGSMPAWKSKLSDKEVDDIIAWFQSHWSDEIYLAWQDRDRG